MKESCGKPIWTFMNGIYGVPYADKIPDSTGTVSPGVTQVSAANKMKLFNKFCDLACDTDTRSFIDCMKTNCPVSGNDPFAFLSEKNVKSCTTCNRKADICAFNARCGSTLKYAREYVTTQSFFDYYCQIHSCSQEQKDIVNCFLNTCSVKLAKEAKVMRLTNDKKDKNIFTCPFCAKKMYDCAKDDTCHGQLEAFKKAAKSSTTMTPKVTASAMDKKKLKNVAFSEYSKVLEHFCHQKYVTCPEAFKDSVHCIRDKCIRDASKPIPRGCMENVCVEHLKDCLYDEKCKEVFRVFYGYSHANAFRKYLKDIVCVNLGLTCGDTFLNAVSCYSSVCDDDDDSSSSSSSSDDKPPGVGYKDVYVEKTWKDFSPDMSGLGLTKFSAVVSGSKLYVSDSVKIVSLDLTAKSASWSTVKSGLNYPGTQMVSDMMGNVYFACGTAQKVYKFNIEGDSITELTPPKEAQYCCPLVSGKKLYLLGGISGGQSMNHTQKYDLVKKKWVISKSLQQSRAHAGCLSQTDGMDEGMYDKLYVFGGMNGGSGLRSIEGLENYSGWQLKKTSFRYAMKGIRGVYLSDSLMLFSGGYRISPAGASKEVYLFDALKDQIFTYSVQSTKNTHYMHGLAVYRKDQTFTVYVVGSENQNYVQTLTVRRTRVCGRSSHPCWWTYSKPQKCFPDIYRCDGRKDCPNGEDEFACKRSTNCKVKCHRKKHMFHDMRAPMKSATTMMPQTTMIPETTVRAMAEKWPMNGALTGMWKCATCNMKLEECKKDATCKIQLNHLRAYLNGTYTEGTIPKDWAFVTPVPKKADLLKAVPAQTVANMKKLCGGKCAENTEKLLACSQKCMKIHSKQCMYMCYRQYKLCYFDTKCNPEQYAYLISARQQAFYDGLTCKVFQCNSKLTEMMNCFLGKSCIAEEYKRLETAKPKPSLYQRLGLDPKYAPYGKPVCKYYLSDCLKKDACWHQLAKIYKYPDGLATTNAPITTKMGPQVTVTGLPYAFMDMEMGHKESEMEKMKALKKNPYKMKGEDLPKNFCKNLEGGCPVQFMQVKNCMMNHCVKSTDYVISPVCMKRLCGKYVDVCKADKHCKAVMTYYHNKARVHKWKKRVEHHCMKAIGGKHEKCHSDLVKYFTCSHANYPECEHKCDEYDLDSNYDCPKDETLCWWSNYPMSEMEQHSRRLTVHGQKNCFKKSEDCDGKKQCQYGEDEKGCTSDPSERFQYVLKAKLDVKVKCTDCENLCKRVNWKQKVKERLKNIKGDYEVNLKCEVQVVSRRRVLASEKEAIVKLDFEVATSSKDDFNTAIQEAPTFQTAVQATAAQEGITVVSVTAQEVKCQSKNADDCAGLPSSAHTLITSFFGMFATALVVLFLNV